MWLSDAQAQELVAHARADAPREACGLIVGRHGRATEIIPIPNTASNPLHAYRMDERALVAALSRLEARGLELVGFYHSHPASDPIPSPTDIRQATYPDTPYLIIGLKEGAAQMAVWTMRAGQVSEVPLYIGSTPPSLEPQALSNAQKTAILLSALIAFALLLMVSLSLLPPAPIIPR